MSAVYNIVSYKEDWLLKREKRHASSIVYPKSMRRLSNLSSTSCLVRTRLDKIIVKWWRGSITMYQNVLISKAHEMRELRHKHAENLLSSKLNTHRILDSAPKSLQDRGRSRNDERHTDWAWVDLSKTTSWARSSNQIRSCSYSRGVYMSATTRHARPSIIGK